MLCIILPSFNLHVKFVICIWLNILELFLNLLFLLGINKMHFLRTNVCQNLTSSCLIFDKAVLNQFQQKYKIQINFKTKKYLLFVTAPCRIYDFKIKMFCQSKQNNTKIFSYYRINCRNFFQNNISLLSWYHLRCCS